MTLLSTEGDVKIGSDLCHFAADGSVIVVTGDNCTVLEKAKADPQYTHENLQRLFNVAAEPCQHIEHETAEKPFLNDEHRKCIWRIDFDSYVANSRVKTTSRNFRWKNESWKRAPAKTRVRVEGQVWNNECLQNGCFHTKRKQQGGNG